MNLADAILVVMEKAAPPGKSSWSVEPVPVTECASTQKVCPGAKWSSFYSGWVRKESVEHARARYARMARVLAQVLEGSKNPIEEASRVLGAAINESGFREDIEFGRGKNGKPSDDGGEGRGPSGEVCVMQILPSMAHHFGGAEALLGDSDEALTRCFTAGLEQLRHASHFCTENRRTLGRIKVGQRFATYSMYGTGNSCTSGNHGKTQRRVDTSNWVTVLLRSELAKQDDTEVAAK